MADREGTMSGKQVSILLEAVGSAASSQMPLEVTLAALAEEKEDPRLAAIARRLVTELERGVPVEQAVKGLERQLPAEVRGLLRAGIESGDLAGTLTRFTDQRLVDAANWSANSRDDRLSHADRGNHGAADAVYQHVRDSPVCGNV